jgi:ABC-type Fe3+ transport system substrate-binding protein
VGGGGRRWQGEVGCPASLASGMSDKAVLEDESVEAEPFSGLDGNEEGWRWLATVESKAAAIAVE